MKILLMNSPLSPAGDEFYQFYKLPPLGLAQLAAIIRKKHDVKILDSKVLSLNMKQVISKIKRIKPDLIGISNIASSDSSNSQKTAGEIKKIFPNITIVAGGAHPTFRYREMLNDFDFVVRGEGEITFSELVDCIDKGDNLRKIKGICYRKNEKIRVNKPRPLIKNLDSLPFPARDLLPNKKYKFYGFEKKGLVTTIESSRGCPFRCNFCSVTSMWGHKWRCKSVDRIIKELKFTEEQGFKGYFFSDDNFVFPGKVGRNIKLCKEILRNKIDINFGSQIRPDIVAENPEFIKIASKAGMKMTTISYETFNKHLLKDENRKIDVSCYKKTADNLRKNNILIQGHFMFGLSEKEKEKDIDLTTRLSKKFSDIPFFALCTPLPGSDIYRGLNINNFNYNEKELTDYLLLKRKLNPEQLKKKIRKAHFSFYSRPKIFYKMLFSKNLYERTVLKKIISFHLKKFVERYLKFKIP